MSNYLFNRGKIKCEHCGPIPVSHKLKWVEDFLYIASPARSLKLNPKIESIALRLFEVPMFFFGVLKLSDDLENKDISFRSRVFIREAIKRGIKVSAVKSSWGYINKFYMEKNGKKVPFEGLPMMDSFSRFPPDMIDDKAYVKRLLLGEGLPTPKGKSFWFFQRKSSCDWAIRNIGFPLVVKPIFGSMSQHVTTDINSREELEKAVEIAITYGPTFIIEKYLPNTHVYRATVIDTEKVACVRRIPAHVTGDGKLSISQLIGQKNSEVGRGNPRDHDCTVFKITFDDKSAELLGRAGMSLESVPEKDKVVFLQEKVILDIGADIQELTGKIHPDNQELFLRVAKAFDSRLIGIDFLASDISVSWRDQPCAVIELNSLPYIDTHHFPSRGESVNVGSWLAEAVDKYYFQ